MSTRQKIRVALVGAGAAGQAHAFGYRNVSMAAGLDAVDIDLAVVVDPVVELVEGPPTATDTSRPPLTLSA